MDIAFSSPWGGLVAVAAVLPVALLVTGELRARRLRRTLGLAHPAARSFAAIALAVIAVPLLLGLAAAQPVIHRNKTHYVRTDAAAFFALDTSRSMLASGSRGGATRFERAQDAALKLRSDLSDIPAGIASLTDRLLPHLFPTGNMSAFAGTLGRTVGVEHPPPERVHSRATTLYGLTALATQNYFGDAAKRRVAFVLTDGESSPFEEREFARDFRGAHIHPIFIRFWGGDERVYARSGKPESYRPDSASLGALERLAGSSGGQVFSEHDLGAAASAARGALGKGPRVTRGREDDSFALAPYAAFAALLALGFLLWERNLWGLARLPRPLRPARP